MTRWAYHNDREMNKPRLEAVFADRVGLLGDRGLAGLPTVLLKKLQSKHFQSHCHPSLQILLNSVSTSWVRRPHVVPSFSVSLRLQQYYKDSLDSVTPSASICQIFLGQFEQQG